jgi:hypothetical protein
MLEVSIASFNAMLAEESKASSFRDGLSHPNVEKNESIPVN